MKENKLVHGKLFPVLIQFTIPFLISSLLQTAYGMVDVMVIGRFGTPADVSAVATSSQMINLVTAFMIGVTNGAVVLLGQYLGAEKKREVTRVIGNSIVLFASIALLLTVLYVVFREPILQVVNIPEEALQGGIQYLVICALGIPMIVGYNTVCAILRGMGDSTRPMVFVAVACVVNIIGDLVLTGYLGMGAAGVAIATTCSQAISFLIGLFYLMKTGVGVPFCRKDIRWETDVVKKILHIGIPLGAKSVMVSLSFLLLTSIINAMGVVYSAAMGVGDKIVNIAFLPHSAFAGAISVIVAQNMGAGRPDRAKKATLYAILICEAWALMFITVSYLWPNFFPSLFNRDSEVIQMTGIYLKAYSLDGLMTAITFCLGSMFSGCGKSGFVFVLDMVTTFLVRMPVAWFVSRIAGATLFHIGLAVPLCSAAYAVIAIWYFRSGKWQEGFGISRENA